jgi:hypothetical protein
MKIRRIAMALCLAALSAVLASICLAQDNAPRMHQSCKNYVRLIRNEQHLQAMHLVRA